jgi:arylsulfatase A-like enzyme
MIAAVFFSYGYHVPSFAASKDAAFEDDPDIVLITIDTLRADHLSCYGYERKTTPNIDEIAEKGTVFTKAIAPSSWTAPSMVSLFTSVYPVNHGITLGFLKEGKIQNQMVFSDKLVTLAQALKARGYATFAVASNLHLSEELGFARGFDHFRCLDFRTAPSVNSTVYSWLNQIKNSPKFFLWVHYFDPHYPYFAKGPWAYQYIPPDERRHIDALTAEPMKHSELRAMVAEKPELLPTVIGLYDSEISYVDFHLGFLLDKLNLDTNTVIAITSDHGEEFMEHAHMGHSSNLYQEQIHVPLIIKTPESSRKEIFEEHVNLVDFMPTLLYILGGEIPEQSLGRSIVARKSVVSGVEQPYIFSELNRMTRIKAIFTPEWKYIYDYKSDSEQLYHLEADRFERANRLADNGQEASRLKAELFEWVKDATKYPIRQSSFAPSPEQQEKLKSLGYIK